MDDRDSTERPSLRKHGVGEIELWGGCEALSSPIDTITDTVRPLCSPALTNTLLLFLLFYECSRREERDRADFPDSDNISNQASKNHFTNHPAGRQKAAGLHNFSHSSRVHAVVCTPSSYCRFTLLQGGSVDSKILSTLIYLFFKSIGC